MEVVQTEDRRFVRDLHSKALLNTDRVALENHRNRRKLEQQQANEWQEMKNKVEELNNVRSEMLEIKCLLQELLTKKEL
jgi:hypothetical protein|tara:strand:- start:437 stop:673 length:237 start_codon:yes stop_codon:yes gene_type:complete